MYADFTGEQISVQILQILYGTDKPFFSDQGYGRISGCPDENIEHDETMDFVLGSTCE